MDVIKIALFGLVAVLLVMILRSYKNEWAILLSLTAGVLIAVYLVGFLLELSQVLSTWETYLAGVSDYMGVLWKALGITYVCEFAGSLCRDNGNTLIAGQIELCGKVAVMLLGMPVLWALLQTVTGYGG